MQVDVQVDVISERRAARRAALVVCAIFAVIAANVYAETDAQTAAVSDSPVTVFGFGEFGYLSNDDVDPNGFVIGQAVGHLSASLAERISLFSEATVSARDKEYKIELERLFVRYDHSDAAKFSIGRFHTPLGYWNAAYHHGAWLQTAAARPFVIKFGSQVIPIHFVGLVFEGNVPSGDWSIGYAAGVGNGRSDPISRAGDAGDINSRRAWFAGVRASSFGGIRIGATVYSDVASPEAGPEVDETIISGYAVYDKGPIEIIGEYHHLDHESRTGPEQDTSNGYYLQFGYRFPSRYPLTPYARYEEVDVGDDDPLLQGRGLDQNAKVIGLRYDLAATVALTGEFRREEFADSGDAENVFFIQLSFVVGGGTH